MGESTTPPRRDRAMATEEDGLTGRGMEPIPENDLLDKLQRDWLVPIGVGTTALVLASGLKSFRDGNALRSQFFMRARVAAQGFSIAAIMWSLHYESKYPHPYRQKRSASYNF